LYRHFPTRDALLEAVYRTEVKLAAAEPRFAESMPPIEALRAWMLLFVDYIAASHISHRLFEHKLTFLCCLLETAFATTSGWLLHGLCRESCQ